MLLAKCRAIESQGHARHRCAWHAPGPLSDWYTVVSAVPAPLTPAWLAVPADVNELHAAVWPSGTERTAAGIAELGGIAATELAEQFGTPLYVVDEDVVRARATAVREAFDNAAGRVGTTAKVYYAGKALLTTEVARWVYECGLNVDVASRGELETALAGGVPAAKLGYHGNNKSFADIARAIAVGVGSIVVDSEVEIERISQAASAVGTEQSILIRVNTGIHAETHSYLATAHEDQKFGTPIDKAAALAARAHDAPGVTLDGFHCHIGSQIFGSQGFAESARRLVQLYAHVMGDKPGTLNLGGGFGVAYTSVDTPEGIDTLALAIATAVAEECVAQSIRVPVLAFEPGRFIVGPAGVTLYTVGTTKLVTLDQGDRLYVSVDGGMSDNARPALYEAQYSARVLGRESDAAPQLSRVVGSHCESGDIVVDYEYLPQDITPGDLLGVPTTGAYCYSLASNYNQFARPPLVALRGGEARVIVRGETIDDVLSRDVGYTPTQGRNA